MKLYFESYGCTLNFGEARMMKEIAIEGGHSSVDSPINADVIVIVTCTVVAHTEEMMVRKIRALSKFGKPLVVVGCMASAQRRLVEKLADGLILLPPCEMRNLNDILSRISPNGCHAVEHQYRVPKRKDDALDSFDAIIPICQGCTGTCTYCITRIARGKLHSYPPESIVEMAKRAILQGQRELRITAQDSASYGLDFDGGMRLPGLVAALASIDVPKDKEYRLRLGMMNPDTALGIADELAAVFGLERVYKFAHIPAQSGDDSILQDMGRRYTAEQFKLLVEKLRKAHPGMTLATDVIAGFPGETDAQFEKTCALMTEIKPDVINIKGFSPRPGTEAANMRPMLGITTIKARTRKLTELRTSISLSNNMARIGTRARALVVEHGKVKGSLICRTDSYAMAVIQDNLPLGTFVEVEITGATHWYLKGKVV